MGSVGSRGRTQRGRHAPVTGPISLTSACVEPEAGRARSCPRRSPHSGRKRLDPGLPPVEHAEVYDDLRAFRIGRRRFSRAHTFTSTVRGLPSSDKAHLLSVMQNHLSRAQSSAITSTSERARAITASNEVSSAR